MSISKALEEDFAHEATIARRLLEMVPEDKLAWKPIEDSMSLGRLAVHVAQIICWIEPIMMRDSLDLDGEPFYSPVEPSGLVDVLVELGSRVGDFHRLLGGAGDEELSAQWALRRGGHEIAKMSRATAVRRFILSHMSHHCGQLSVYLWSVGVDVPQVYRPTPDHVAYTVEESEYDRGYEGVAEEELAAVG